MIVTKWTHVFLSGVTVERTIRLAEPVGQRRDQRTCERRRTSLPGRLVWRDARSAMRFATVLIRDVSELGAYVECVSGTPIPLHRLVFLQAEREVAGHGDLPDALKRGRVLSAVYRIGPSQPSTGIPQGYGLRLLVEPRTRRSAGADARSDRSTDVHSEASALA